MRDPSTSVPTRPSPGVRPSAPAPRLRPLVALLPTLGALLPALGACAGGEDGSAPVTVRDSSGVRIVENQADLGSLPVRRLAPEPELRSGTLDGPPALQFFQVSDAIRLDDGRLVVADGGSAEIRVFDGDGAHVVSFGGEGEGPEQFAAPGHLWATGDTLEVYDSRLFRTSTWSLEGELIDVGALDPGLRGEGVGRFGDGSLLLIELVIQPPTAEFATWSMRLHTYGRDGVRIGTVGEFPWMAYGALPEHGGGPPHFAPRSVAAAGAERVYQGRARRYEVEVLTPEGELKGLIRWRGPPQEVTEEHLRALRASELARIEEAGPEEARAGWADRFDAFPVSDILPALVDLGVDRDGRLWVREFVVPGLSPAQRWLVFDPEGALEARVELPEAVRLLEAGGDEVVAVETDELGVERIVVYELATASS